MSVSDAAFLDVLGTCLGASVSVTDALARIETAGPRASRWVQRLRPHVRQDAPVESALHAAGTIDASEEALLALAVTPDAMEALLHGLAARRRRRDAVYRVILQGLVGPFSIAALTVVLDPLPNLLGSESYVAPVLRGMLVLAAAGAAIVLGIPAALRSTLVGPRFRELSARLPGLSWVAARHAEGELVTVSAPFVGRSELGTGGLLAAAAMLSWSPLAERVRAAALANATAPEWALARLAPSLSLETNLSIVRGIAGNQLGARLVARGEELAAEVTGRLRVGIKVVAYVLVVVLSFASLANMVSRALPWASGLPGVTPTTEQQQLDEVMQELEGPKPPPKPSK